MRDNKGDIGVGYSSILCEGGRMEALPPLCVLGKKKKME